MATFYEWWVHKRSERFKPVLEAEKAWEGPEADETCEEYGECLQVLGEGEDLYELACAIEKAWEEEHGPTESGEGSPRTDPTVQSDRLSRVQRDGSPGSELQPEAQEVALQAGARSEPVAGVAVAAPGKPDGAGSRMRRVQDDDRSPGGVVDAQEEDRSEVPGSAPKGVGRAAGAPRAQVEAGRGSSDPYLADRKVLIEFLTAHRAAAGAKRKTTVDLYEQAMAIGSWCPCYTCRQLRLNPDPDANRPDPPRP